MSRMTPHELQCPHCGNKQETEVWDSLNVTLDPELKKKLFDAEVNFFVCAKCGKKTFINAPLLYHDMNQHFCVQYYSPAALDAPEFLAIFNPDASIAMHEPMDSLKVSDYIARPHVVFDMNEMLRYVTFRDRLAAVKGEAVGGA